MGTSMSEKKKIDILGDILNDSPSGTIRGIDELMKLTHANPDTLQEKTLVASQKIKKKYRREKKRKTTHYLTNEVFDNLDEVKEGIRDFLPADSKNKASKSRIVESAITVVLHEFEEKGKESALVRELLKKNHDKS